MRAGIFSLKSLILAKIGLSLLVIPVHLQSKAGNQNSKPKKAGADARPLLTL
jgi:hypothetical protein